MDMGMNFTLARLYSFLSVPEPKVATSPVNLLNSCAAKIIILDELSVPYDLNIPNLTNILFVKGNITSDNDLKRVFYEKLNYIFHLAAFFVNQNSEDYPEKDLMVGQLCTTKILEYCLLLGVVKQFAYANSGNNI